MFSSSAPCFFQFPTDASNPTSILPPRLSTGLCSLHFRREFEDAIDVEDDHELTIEAVDAAGELGHAWVEVDGVFLAAGLGQAKDFADGVDLQAVGFAALVDADRHRRLAVVVFGQPEPGAH